MEMEKKNCIYMNSPRANIHNMNYRTCMEIVHGNDERFNGLGRNGAGPSGFTGNCVNGDSWSDNWGVVSGAVSAAMDKLTKQHQCLLMKSKEVTGGKNCSHYNRKTTGWSFSSNTK